MSVKTGLRIRLVFVHEQRREGKINPDFSVDSLDRSIDVTRWEGMVEARRGNILIARNLADKSEFKIGEKQTVAEFNRRVPLSRRNKKRIRGKKQFGPTTKILLFPSRDIRDPAGIIFIIFFPSFFPLSLSLFFFFEHYLSTLLEHASSRGTRLVEKSIGSYNFISDSIRDMNGLGTVSITRWIDPWKGPCSILFFSLSSRWREKKGEKGKRERKSFIPRSRVIIFLFDCSALIQRCSARF